MPKAQVLVTVTAEALVDVPEGVEDVASYVREHAEIAWGGLVVDGVVQPAAVSVEHYFVPEPAAEPEPEPGLVEAEAPWSPEDTLPLPAVVAQEPPPPEIDLMALFDDPTYRNVIRTVVRERAERLIEEVVSQVVAELEPLLRRHNSRNASGVD
jgi:hypothetical protein